MTSSGFYQEKKHKFADLFINSKDLLFLEFNKKGELLFANEALEELLGWQPQKIQELNTSGLFDFRISEVERILAENEEYSCEINLITENKEFIPSRTKFIRDGETVAALCVPLFDVYEEEKNSC